MSLHCCRLDLHESYGLLHSHVYNFSVLISHSDQFVAACKKPPVYCVITEYLSEGSLRAHLHKLEDKSIPLQKLITTALEVARGMEYVHSQGVIHRDLKPENILIDQDFHLKIADFGIACDEAYCDTLADDPGTYRWMAPEMIKRKSYGRKVDVYSFGLILWEMVAGVIPYEDMTPIQAAFAVVTKVYACFLLSCACRVHSEYDPYELLLRWLIFIYHLWALVKVIKNSKKICIDALKLKRYILKESYLHQIELFTL